MDVKPELDQDSDNNSASSFENDITSAQLKLVSKFVKTCGFKGLMDYETEVSARTLSTNLVISKLDKYAKDIDRLFPVHEINLRRTDFKFTSETLAMNILRSLLTFVGVRWNSRRTQSTVFIRLVPEEQYEHTMNLIKDPRIAKPEISTANLTFSEIASECSYPRYQDNFLNIILTKKWMQTNTKTLSVSTVSVDGKDCSDLLQGKPYHICCGGYQIFEGKIDIGKNLYPTKYVPFASLFAHELTLIIELTDISQQDIDQLILVFSLVAYNDGKPQENQDLTSVNWITKGGDAACLRFKYGMCCLSKPWVTDMFCSINKFVHEGVNCGYIKNENMLFSDNAIYHLCHAKIHKPQDGNQMTLFESIENLDMVANATYCKFRVPAYGNTGAPWTLVDQYNIPNCQIYTAGCDLVANFKLKSLTNIHDIHPQLDFANIGTELLTITASTTDEDGFITFDKLNDKIGGLSMILSCATNNKHSFIVSGVQPGLYVLKFDTIYVDYEYRRVLAINNNKSLVVNLADVKQILKQKRIEEQNKSCEITQQLFEAGERLKNVKKLGTVASRNAT